MLKYLNLMKLKIERPQHEREYDDKRLSEAAEVAEGVIDGIPFPKMLIQ